MLSEEELPQRGLQQANGLRSVATSTAQILGPSLAGLIVAVGGPGWAIAIDAATYAVRGKAGRDELMTEVRRILASAL